MHMHTKFVPHSGNVLRREHLMANLVNHQQFGKLKPSEFVATINNLLVKLFIRQKIISQTFIVKVFIHPLSPNIILNLAFNRVNCYKLASDR